MRYYKNIFVLENINRQHKLREFRDLAIKYFDNISPTITWYTEHDEAIRVRPEINHRISKIHSIILACGINPSIICTPNLAMGGSIHNIDLITNIFNIYTEDIDIALLIDFIDKSWSKYNDDMINSLLRPFNPLFWFSLIFGILKDVLFKFIGMIGFNQPTIKNSLVGLLIKGTVGLIGLIVALLAIYDRLKLYGYIS